MTRSIIFISLVVFVPPALSWSISLLCRILQAADRADRAREAQGTDSLLLPATVTDGMSVTFVLSKAFADPLEPTTVWRTARLTLSKEADPGDPSLFYVDTNSEAFKHMCFCMWLTKTREVILLASSMCPAFFCVVSEHVAAKAACAQLKLSYELVAVLL